MLRSSWEEIQRRREERKKERESNCISVFLILPFFLGVLRTGFLLLVVPLSFCQHTHSPGAASEPEVPLKLSIGCFFVAS